MRKGQKHTPEALAKIRAARATQTPWNKGLSVPRTKASRIKQAETVRAKWADPDWREARGKTELTYSGIHSKLGRERPVSGQCQAHLLGFRRCHRRAKDHAIPHDKATHFDKHGRGFSQNLDDYVFLCRSTHATYDGNGNPNLGGMFRGENHGRAKLTEKEVARIRETYAAGNKTLVQLGRQYEVSFSTISRIVRGETWKQEEDLDDKEEE